jgi:membrane-bound metal-dependent hydrolase YbcI (DUF457 family)
MPVLGHAFVGWATGLAVHPTRLDSVSSESPSVAHSGAILGEYWVTLALILGYLPDIVGQSLAILGIESGRFLAHSLVFAIASASTVAFALTIGTGMRFLRGLAFSLGSILGHDLLDLIQATDRMPWWPFSQRPMGLGLELIPVGTFQEAVWFGAAFLVLLGIRSLRRQPRAAAVRHSPSGRRSTTHITFVVILFAAGATHALRGYREHELAVARDCLDHRDYAGALRAADRAEHWPSAARPGRILHVRAESHFGLGLLATAEQEYRLAYAADPTYFWALADLTICLASSDRSLRDRRVLVEPYLRRMRSDFAREPRLQVVLERVQRKLADRPL